jgi:hypothetical protein
MKDYYDEMFNELWGIELEIGKFYVTKQGNLCKVHSKGTMDSYYVIHRTDKKVRLNHNIKDGKVAYIKESKFDIDKEITCEEYMLNYFDAMD